MRWVFILFAGLGCIGLGANGLVTPKSSVEICQGPLLVELNKVESIKDVTEKETEKARINFYLGRCLYTENDSDNAIPYFEKGVENSEAALQVKQEDSIALFWWAANKGVIADIKRSLSALKTIKDIEDKMVLIRSNLPEYGFAGADRVLGKIYQKAPRFISIGSTSKAEECLKRAYEKFPKFPGNIIALAEFYDEEGKREEAKKLILSLLASQEIEKGNFGLFNVEKKEWARDAAALVKKWEKKSE